MRFGATNHQQWLADYLPLGGHLWGGTEGCRNSLNRTPQKDKENRLVLRGGAQVNHFLHHPTAGKRTWSCDLSWQGREERNLLAPRTCQVNGGLQCVFGTDGAGVPAHQAGPWDRKHRPYLSVILDGLLITYPNRSLHIPVNRFVLNHHSIPLIGFMSHSISHYMMIGDIVLPEDIPLLVYVM